MSRSPESRHKNQMAYLRSCFERENKRWAEILESPSEMEKRLSKRLDSDKIIFAPKLTRFQLEALRNAQTAEAIRLQQSYQSIRKLEAAIAAKRQVAAAKRNIKFVSRFLGVRKPKLNRTVEKIASEVDRRTLREMQRLLFQIKRDYRAAHKRYAQIYGFHSYANHSTQALTHRHQNQSV